MHSRLRTGKLIWFLGVAVLIAAGAASFIPKAQANRDYESVFGLNTISRGQTLRLHAVNSGDAPGAVRVRMNFDIYSLGGPDTFEGSVCPAGVVAACTNNLRWVRRESCEISMVPNSAAACDFTAIAAGAFVNTSLLIEENSSGATILPTLEVRENNRTLYLHPGVTRGFNPQPDPPQS